MSLMDLFEQTADVRRKHGLATSAKVLSQNFLRGLAVRAAMVRGAFDDPGTVLEADWDLFLVLDACRYDLMAEVADEYDFLETLEPHWSYAASSQDWIHKTFMQPDVTAGERLSMTAKLFRDPYQNDVIGHYFAMRDVSDVAYVTGNPQTQMLDPEAFHTFEEVWKTDWKRQEEGYVHPRGLTEATIRTMRGEDPPARTVVHYMQPHGAFRNAENPGIPWRKIQTGARDAETNWEYYRDNLRWVLDEVELLLDNVDADTVVISADHGNSTGEYGIYGHRPYLPFSGMRQVPWVETTATDSGEYEPSTAEEVDTDREELLEALGYR